MQFLAKGKRGKVYLTERGTIIKKADDSRVRNEVCWLGILNKKGIGARLIEHGGDWFECEYIEGCVIEEYIKKADKKRIVKILKDCLKQCRIMDRLGVNKKELHHPYKHIIIRKNKPVFIDFERCKRTENPKNVTQFCQDVLKLAGMFPWKIKIEREEMIKAMKAYKSKPDEKKFKKIFALL